MNTKISVVSCVLSSIVLLSACGPSVAAHSAPVAAPPQRVAASQTSVRTAVLELGRRYDRTQSTAETATAVRTAVLELGRRYDQAQSTAESAVRTAVLELDRRYDQAQPHCSKYNRQSNDGARARPPLRSNNGC